MTTATMRPDGSVTFDTDAPVTKAAIHDGVTTSQSVIKSIVAQRYTLSVGYPADLADAAVARDGHRDFANPDEVEKAAWAYIKVGAVGLRHEDGTEGHGDIVESYVYRGPDWPVDGQVIKSGDWLIGVIWDEPTWADIEKGLLNGTSMQGNAKRRDPNPADLARVLSKRG